MSVQTFLAGIVRLRSGIRIAASAVVLATTVAIGCTLMLGVIVRYILAGSVAWASEVPVMLFPWLIMAGIVLAAVHEEHLGVDFFARKLPPAWQRALQLAVLVLVAALMLALAAQAPSILSFMQYRSTPVLGLPSTWAFYSVPIGMLAVAAVALLRLAEVATQPLAGRGGRA
ncbi:TRAP transporter small permease [Spiribacter halobius]|uniref:TRAP transporter small permease protein n=1 Tax=Sediminicurvatus halobius TaxID=2182432 RepID=A0A2U2N9C7_9GAMM|nr:TRAP transporter small permease subunit [Spiribacter halobius]PWG65796.1 hypothetical protein DEM34_00590 [Spiribacter halobius]UEX77838.1 TRAP transporter small permease subunit [Spiribacter halobius]